MEETHNNLIAGLSGEVEAETKRHRRRDADEVTVLRHQLAEQGAQIAQLTDLVQRGMALPEDDDPYPLYEIGIGGYFSRDCVNYPPGAMMRDKTGYLVPNQEWQPLNAAAARNMDAYLASLPDKGILTPKERDDLIPQAELELRNDAFASESDRKVAVLERALNLKRRQAAGVTAHRGRPDPNVPIMSNVRIQQSNTDDKAAMGGPGRLFPGGARPTPHPAGSETELYRGPVPAANKAAPVFSNVQSQPLGTVGID